jgi:biopolymer transport protein ExbB/TolQ
MMTPRETWTDQRLDDLDKKVDEGFKKVDARLDRFETRMDNDIRELRRMMFQGFITLVTIMVSGFMGLFGLIVF